MADDKKAEKGGAEEAPQSSGGGKKTLILIVLVVVIAALGGGGYMMLAGHAQDGQAKKEAPAPKKSDAPPVFSKLDTFVVNLTGPGDTLLQVDIQAELTDAEAQKRLTDYMPKVRSAVILLLSAKTAAEMATPAGKLKLKNQVKQVINGAIESPAGEEPVKSVLFTSFIMQNS